jgi:hypothetical protein
MAEAAEKSAAAWLSPVTIPRRLLVAVSMSTMKTFHTPLMSYLKIVLSSA